MKSPKDKRATQILRAAKPRGIGNSAHAGSSAGAETPASASTIVVEGKVRREWLVGDPWTDDFYFKEFDTK